MCICATYLYKKNYINCFLISSKAFECIVISSPNDKYPLDLNFVFVQIVDFVDLISGIRTGFKFIEIAGIVVVYIKGKTNLIKDDKVNLSSVKSLTKFFKSKSLEIWDLQRANFFDK